MNFKQCSTLRAPALKSIQENYDIAVCPHRQNRTGFAGVPCMSKSISPRRRLYEPEAPADQFTPLENQGDNLFSQTSFFGRSQSKNGGFEVDIGLCSFQSLLSEAEPCIGNDRMRILFSSKTAIQPSSKSLLIACKLERSKASWSSGLRSVPRLNKITEGFLSCLIANNTPKSVSAEINILSSSSALANTCSSLEDCKP